MKNTMTRRKILKVSAGTVALAACGTLLAGALGKGSGKIVVIGGGAAGGAVSIAVKSKNPDYRVTLIERDPTRLAPQKKRPMLTGMAHSVAYSDLMAANIDLGVDEIAGIDWTAKQAIAFSGRKFPFDHLVVAPGITPQEEGIEGYGPVAAHEFPHAWTGGRQAYRLQAQIEAMADGGTVIIRVPAGPQRFPIGPYQRAERIARYLVNNKPRSKVIILDEKDSFPNQDAFQQEWAANFPDGLIEWVSASAGGRVSAIDVAQKSLQGSGGWVRGDVINFIPAQQAGVIAQTAGLTDATGWCPVETNSLRSRLQSSASILGDANNAGNGDKSADNARLQARICAQVITLPT